MIFQHNSLLYYLMGIFLMKNSYLLKKIIATIKKIVASKLKYCLNKMLFLLIGNFIRNI